MDAMRLVLVTGAVAAVSCVALASLPAAAGFGRAEIHARWTCTYVGAARVRVAVALSNRGDVRGSGLVRAVWLLGRRPVVGESRFSLAPSAAGRRVVVLARPAPEAGPLPPLTARSCVVKLLDVRAGR